MTQSYFKIGILDISSEEIEDTSEIDKDLDIVGPYVHNTYFALANESKITLQTLNFDYFTDFPPAIKNQIYEDCDSLLILVYNSFYFFKEKLKEE